MKKVRERNLPACSAPGRERRCGAGEATANCIAAIPCYPRPMKRAALFLELAAWIAVFVWLFAGRGATANLLFVLPIVLALIGLRLAASIVTDEFASVWRGMTWRD